MFAEELQKAANASGALEAKLQTTMTQQGRFIKQLETAQDIIFRGGMDEGGAVLFNQLAKGLDESEHGLKSFGKVFKAVFKTVAGLAKVLMPILSDLATIVGTLAQGLMTIFGSTTGRIFVGMMAFNRVLGMLNTSTGRLALNWAAVLGTITEVIALFTRGYVGVTELALGGDLALGELEIFQKLGEIFNSDGVLGEALQTIIFYLPAILAAIAALNTLLFGARMFKGVYDKILSSTKKGAKTPKTNTGSTKTTTTGKETRRHGHGGKTASTASQASKLELLLRSGGLARLLGLSGAGLGLVANSNVYSNKEDMLAELSDSRTRLKSFMESFKLNPASSAIFDRLQGKSTIIEKQENHITVPAGTTSEQVQFLRDEWDRIMMNNAVQ